MEYFRAFYWRTLKWGALRAKDQAGLFTFITLVCLALVGLDTLNLWNQRSQATAEGGRGTSNLARSLARHADDAILAVDAVIAGLVERLEVDGTTPAALARIRGTVRARMAILPQLNGITVSDADGNLLVTSQPTTPKVNIADREYFQFHKSHAERGAHLSAPVKSRVTGAWVIPVTRRITGTDGSFAGVLLAALDMAYFQKFYDGFEIGADGAILLADTGGTLLVRRPFAEVNIGKSLRDSDFFQEVLAKPRFGTTQVTSATDGIVRLVSYERTAAYPLVVAVALGKDDMLAHWRANAWRHVVVVGTIITGVLALGVRLMHQIELRNTAQHATEAATAQYRLLADNSTDVIMLIGPDAKRLYVSPASRSLFGYEPEELMSRPVGELVHPEDRTAWTESRPASLRLSEHEATHATYRVIRKDGSSVWVESSRQQLPRDLCYVVNVRDISRRKQVEETLRLSEERFHLLVEGVKDYAIIMLDPQGRIVTWNEGAQRLKGYTEAEILGQSMALFYPAEAVVAGTPARLLALAAAEGRCANEGWRMRKDGTRFFADVVLTAIRDPAGQLVGFAKITRDISERKEIQDQLAAAHRELEILATQDGLTGLANRRHFDETLDDEFRRAMRDGTSLSLVMIDVDHFKRFNDLYGHPAGDACLRAIGSTLKGAMRRPGDLAARYGGEEFALLLPNTSKIGAGAIARTILGAIQALCIIHDASPEKIVTSTFGVATLAPKQGFNRPEDFVNAADRMLYAAKAGGRNTVRA